MSQTRIGGSSLRTRVETMLRADDFEEHIAEWQELPARRVINPLFGFLCSSDELVKWRAVRAIGAVVARLAECDMESARVIMRRFIWNLNDESGGIGWGSPEAMGEIMALSERLAEEYARILMSYIDLQGNHLENPLLERGVLWGIGRLAQARHHLARDSSRDILRYTKSGDPIQRGYAIWALGFLEAGVPPGYLDFLLFDQTGIDIFECGKLKHYRICDLAARSIGL